jgi:hypothetical protein
MEKGNIILKMVDYMMEIGFIIECMVTENYTILVEKSLMKEIGFKIILMAKVNCIIKQLFHSKRA